MCLWWRCRESHPGPVQSSNHFNITVYLYTKHKRMSRLYLMEMITPLVDFFTKGVIYLIVYASASASVEANMASESRPLPMEFTAFTCIEYDVDALSPVIVNGGTLPTKLPCSKPFM